MITIYKDGNRIALVEKPNYIRQDGDVYILCQESEAQGIAVNSVPYNLSDREPMPGLETVVVVETDGGGRIYQGDLEQANTDELIVDQEYRLTILELGGDASAV